MATVLRVRRKRSSDPSEALIFPCKKARTSGDGSGKGSASAAGAAGGGADIQTVFKFAGTVDKKNQPISQRIQAALTTLHLYANLEPPKPQAKPKPTSTSTTTSSSSSSSASSKKSKKSKSKSKSKSDTKSKSRASQLAAQQEGRFQIVSTYRGVNLKGLDGQSAPSSVSNGVGRNKGATKDELFSLFDAVIDEEAKSSSKTSKSDDITCNSVKMIREKLVIDDGPDSEYVYDLYYTDDNQLDFGQTVVTGVQLEDEELVHDFFDEGSHEKYDDEDDSNDENNCRNDYPDEDPDKRHEDLFDEYKDEYRYGDISSDEDILNDYGDYRKRPTKGLDYFGGGRDPLDDLM
eukprot:XP_001193916.2 PREDICTED: probable RNA polymerase II nuclear localization protein SLC7A6OS [Strongylocentrotus purpuratus]